MIKEPIVLTEIRSRRFDGLVSAPKQRRQPGKLRAQPTGQSQASSTAIILPFPAAGAWTGRGGTNSAVARSQSHADLVGRRTTGSAAIDYVALAFVLASVAIGPVLAWVLL